MKLLKKENVIIVLSFVICLITLLTGYFLFLRQDVSMEQERCRYIAENEAEHILTTIDCVMARSNTLKAMVYDHRGDLSFFDGVADLIYESVHDETGVSLKNIALAPGGVVSDVYPREGNEALIGFDFMDLTKAGNLEAREAYESGETVLTNPFKLIQGGMGMAGRSPVILNDGEKDCFWGLVTVTMDFDNLVKVLRLDNLTGMGINYSLSYIDDDGKAHVLQSNGSVGDDVVNTRFSIRNLNWQLALYPSNGWFSVARTVLTVAVILIISIFAGMFANLILKLKKSNEALLDMSKTDGLTGCLNRRAYEDDLAMYRSDVPADDFVYLSADINGLKKVNDTRGHMAGDELICAASGCLNNNLSSYGKVYRTGGDEFVATLCINETELKSVIEKTMDEAENWKGRSIDSLSVSIGFAAKWEFPDASVSELAKTADQRMYDAKRDHYEKNN